MTAGGSVSNHTFGRGLDIASIDGEIVSPSSRARARGRLRALAVRLEHPAERDRLAVPDQRVRPTSPTPRTRTTSTSGSTARSRPTSSRRPSWRPRRSSRPPPRPHPSSRPARRRAAAAGGGESSLGAAALRVAQTQRGVRETGGANTGPQVDQYLEAAGVAPGNPWCASFITWSLEQAGHKMDGGGWAAVATWVRNAEQGGNGLKLVSAEEARPGDIVAYDWGGETDFGADGHIGFLDSERQGRRVHRPGGQQRRRGQLTSRVVSVTARTSSSSASRATRRPAPRRRPARAAPGAVAAAPGAPLAAAPPAQARDRLRAVRGGRRSPPRSRPRRPPRRRSRRHGLGPVRRRRVRAAAQPGPPPRRRAAPARRAELAARRTGRRRGGGPVGRAGRLSGRRRAEAADRRVDGRRGQEARPARPAPRHGLPGRVQPHQRQLRRRRQPRLLPDARLDLGTRLPRLRQGPRQAARLVPRHRRRRHEANASSAANRSTTPTSSANGSPTSNAPPSNTAAATSSASTKPTAARRRPQDPRRTRRPPRRSRPPPRSPSRPSSPAAVRAAGGRRGGAARDGPGPGPKAARRAQGGREVHRHAVQVGRLDAADRASTAPASSSGPTRRRA